MSVSYDVFTEAFLSKVSEYKFLQLGDVNRSMLVDGYMKRALSAFKKNCKYDLFTTSDDLLRTFSIDIPDEDLDEIADIVSEGMVIQWLKPYTYSQDNLEMVLNTRDFTAYSPAEMLLRIGDVYKDARRNFTNMIREYSYNHGDLTNLHI